MATLSSPTSTAEPRPICKAVRSTPAPLPAGLAPGRVQAIRTVQKKWVNGTVLHYHFLEGDWTWPEQQKDAVRNAFATWKGLGIGLDFSEVDDPSEAELRIGFDQGDGSWSFVGTDVLTNSDRNRTMNYGWDLTDDWGKATALHEIGHAIGLEHEHQSSKAGIQWNEDRVYDSFSGPPNSWSRDMIFQNILKRLDPVATDGSPWDASSIMEYPFQASLIAAPPPYNQQGIGENLALSPQDEAWALRFYPSLGAPSRIGVMELRRLSATSGDQCDFLFEPDATRSYTVRTIGAADSKIVVFVERDGEPRHLAGADDSGTPANAEVTEKLVKGERYIVRVRTHFAGPAGGAGLVIV